MVFESSSFKPEQWMWFNLHRWKREIMHKLCCDKEIISNWLPSRQNSSSLLKSQKMHVLIVYDKVRKYQKLRLLKKLRLLIRWYNKPGDITKEFW